MSKKSLTKRVIWSRMIPGISWILVGVCKLFTDIIAMDILGLVVSFIALLGLISVVRGRYENPDEMAINAMRAAESNAFNVLYIIVIAIALILSYPTLLPMKINLKLVVAAAYVIAGIGFISSGLFFLKYDKEGDF